MTLSTAADNAERDRPVIDPEECGHPNLEARVDLTVAETIEVVAECPDCEVRLWGYLEAAEMRRSA